MRLRSHLVGLVLAAVVPLLVFAIVIVNRDLSAQREIRDRGMRDTVQALSFAADQEMRTAFAVLQSLAASPALDARDWRTFREYCRVASAAPKNLSIALFDPTGQQIVNSGQPLGAPLPNVFRRENPPASEPHFPLLPIGDAGLVRKAFETGQPAVSDLFIGLTTQRPTISVAVPVIRAGSVRYVLGMGVDPQLFAQLLQNHSPPPGRVVRIVDGKGLTIARTTDSAKRLGTPLAPELAAEISKSDAGTGVGHTEDGVLAYHAFIRSRTTGWTTSLSLSETAASAAMAPSIALLTVGALVALLLSVGAALVMGKRVARPISMLANAANAITRGERTDVDVSAVREVEDLRSSLIAAGEAVRRGAAERERRFVAEAKQAEEQAASRAKDEFLAILSHELRNPLAALTAAAHVMKLADPSSEIAIQARGVIERQTKHMSRLVGDLLDIGRVTSGKLVLERTQLNFADVVSGVVDVWRRSGRLARHALTLDTEPAWINADRARIEQIVANLLDNALKFTPTGKAVALTVHREGGSVEFRISDQGEGLAPDIGNVFDLFVQGSHAQQVGGMGVGLALVKRLTDLHGGSVSAASAGPGCGATFTVRLPEVARADAQDLSPDSKLDSGGGRVLIVEDNDDARRMLKAALTLGGHEVQAAHDAASGLALAAAEPPDVALIDIGLPDTSGYEVARRLRATATGGRIGLIALTGYGQAEDTRRAFDAGFDAHLTKPVSADRVAQVIADLHRALR